MKYRCICGYETNDLYDWLYHMGAARTPWMAMREHRRITITLISGI